MIHDMYKRGYTKGMVVADEISTKPSRMCSIRQEILLSTSKFETQTRKASSTAIPVKMVWVSFSVDCCSID